MKYIKSFLDILNEGAHIDPQNPDEVILTYSNLGNRHPQYDNEVLVTLVDSIGKSGSKYALDKYFALVLPSENLTSGLSMMKIKNLDHKGRPKTTMDLLKEGKIKGGQAAVDAFLEKAIPRVGLGNIDYVCSLDSTGPLVKMIENFIISKYGATPVDIPKRIFQTVSSLFNIDPLIDDLIASERIIKSKYKEDLKLYNDQQKYIRDTVFRGLRFTLPYTIKDIGKSITHTEEYEMPIADPAEFIKNISGKQNTIVSQFLSALEESFDLLGTDPKAYNNFVKNKNKISRDILSIYQAAGDISDPFYPEVKASDIRTDIQNIIDQYIKNVAIQQNYKLRTSGTAVGRGARNKFVDKYSYTASFENAVMDCVDNDRKMLIIDDNINTGTDFKRIDKKIQEITVAYRDSVKKFNMTKNIKMFVLYNMSSDFKMKLGSKNVKTLSTSKKDVTDFKNLILGLNSKLPTKVKMSYLIDTSRKIPNKSLPTLELKIDSNGAISSISVNTTKSSLAFASHYSPDANPNNWNFPFTIGDVIFNQTGDLIPPFKSWAKSIGIFVNGEKFK